MGFLDIIERYDHLQRLEELLGIEAKNDALKSPLVNPFVRKHLFRSERTKLVKKIRQELDVYIDKLLDLFNSYEPVYVRYSDRLKKADLKSG
jgi:hypothetical protein